jgi:hypothetical protein
MRRIHPVGGATGSASRNYRFLGTGFGRTSDSVRVRLSWHPTKRTNSCGTDSLPRPPWPHCSVMAPQTLDPSSFRSCPPSICGSRKSAGPIKFSALGRAVLRARSLLPTSMLPLPTKLSLVRFFRNAQLPKKLQAISKESAKAWFWFTSSGRYRPSNWPGERPGNGPMSDFYG